MSFEFMYMLEMLRCIANKTPIQPPQQAIDWNTFIIVANKHRLLSILYSTVMKLPEEHRPPKAQLDPWKQATIMQSVTQLNNNIKLINVLKASAKNNHTVVLMKGLFLSNLYPEPHARIMSDADLLIPPEEEKAIDALLNELGYVLEDFQNDNELTYISGNFRIEVHTRLWEETEGSRYETLESLNINNFDSMVLTELNGVPVYRLSTDDSLIYLFYHMIKHFFINGIGARYLMDMTFFIRQYKDEINWPLFWQKCEKLNYTKFCRRFIHLCVRYLGLEENALGGLVFTKEDRPYEEELLHDICIGGHSGKETTVRNGMGRFMSLYYDDRLNSNAKTSTLWILWTMIRRTNNEIHEKEFAEINGTHVKRSRFVLVAWIQQIFLIISNYHKIQKERGTLWKRIKEVKHRSRFLQDLDLMNKQ